MYKELSERIALIDELKENSKIITYDELFALMWPKLKKNAQVYASQNRVSTEEDFIIVCKEQMIKDAKKFKLATFDRDEEYKYYLVSYFLNSIKKACLNEQAQTGMPVRVPVNTFLKLRSEDKTPKYSYTSSEMLLALEENEEDFDAEAILEAVRNEFPKYYESFEKYVKSGYSRDNRKSFEEIIKFLRKLL